MFYYHDDCELNDVVYDSAGVFMTKKSWIHPERIIDSYELISPIHGNLDMAIDNREYHLEPNDLLILPPGIVHKGLSSTDGVSFYWLHFSCPKLQTVSNQEVDPNILAAPNKLLLPIFSDRLMMDRVKVLLNEILAVSQEEESANYLSSLTNALLYELTLQESKMTDARRSSQFTLQPVTDWIRIHAFDDISLASVADQFGYNKSYLSRIYSKAFGITITERIARFRMTRARNLLISTNLTVEAIALQIGFQNSKYFLKVFKDHEHMTPTEFHNSFVEKHYNQS